MILRSCSRSGLLPWARTGSCWSTQIYRRGSSFSHQVIYRPARSNKPSAGSRIPRCAAKVTVPDSPRSWTNGCVRSMLAESQQQSALVRRCFSTHRSPHENTVVPFGQPGHFVGGHAAARHGQRAAEWRFSAIINRSSLAAVSRPTRNLIDSGVEFVPRSASPAFYIHASYRPIYPGWHDPSIG